MLTGFGETGWHMLALVAVSLYAHLGAVCLLFGYGDDQEWQEVSAQVALGGAGVSTRTAQQKPTAKSLLRMLMELDARSPREGDLTRGARSSSPQLALAHSLVPTGGLDTFARRERGDHGGGVAGSGSLTRARGTLARCYAGQQNIKPGERHFTLTFAASGRVSAVTMKGDAANDGAARCATRVLETLRLRPDASAASAEVDGYLGVALADGTTKRVTLELVVNADFDEQS